VIIGTLLGGNSLPASVCLFGARACCHVRAPCSLRPPFDILHRQRLKDFFLNSSLHQVRKQIVVPEIENPCSLFMCFYAQNLCISIYFKSKISKLVFRILLLLLTILPFSRFLFFVCFQLECLKTRIEDALTRKC